MSAEHIYRHIAAEGFERQPITGFVPFVEGLIATQRGFAVYQKGTGTDISREALLQELRDPKPLIGYGGLGTFPFLSDPDNLVRGAIAIEEGRLVYSPQASPLHDMRDSYTWSYTAANHYYTESNFLTVVTAFVQNGYDLLSSDNLRSNMRGEPINLTGAISLDDLIIEKL